MARRRRIFWTEIDHIKSEWGHSAIFDEYVVPAMQGQTVEVPPKLIRAYKLAVELENLFWDADYHGLDCDSQSCNCKESTHEKTKYPALWKRLEKIERKLKANDA